MNRRNFLAIAASGLIVAADLTLAISADRRDRRRPRPKPDNPIDERAQAIADDLADDPATVGIDPTFWMSLLSILLPMLLKCFMPQQAAPSAAQMRAAAEKVYDPKTDTYDDRTMKRGRVQAKKQAKRNGKLLTNEQADAVVKTSLDHMRLAENEDLKAVGSACWRSPIAAAKED